MISIFVVQYIIVIKKHSLLYLTARLINSVTRFFYDTDKMVLAKVRFSQHFGMFSLQMFLNCYYSLYR